MTTDEAVKLMATIDALYDGTEERMALVKKLHSTLIEAPDTFLETFYEALNGENGNHYRDLAERLLRSGAVTEETTFGDIDAIMAWDRAATAPQQ